MGTRSSSTRDWGDTWDTVSQWLVTIVLGALVLIVVVGFTAWVFWLAVELIGAL